VGEDERERVAERENERPKGKPRRRRRARIALWRRRLRLVWVVGLVAISAYLYYRPLASYFDAKAQLAAQRTQVEVLGAEKARLERRLAESTSLEATQREARKIGYVLPGERLFIVKGIPEWRRAQRTLRRHG
jgi:cell division protein FtsB